MNKLNPIIENDCADILKSVDMRPFKNKRVLLTGANGLLGQYIASLFYVANQKKKLNARLLCVTLHGPSKALRQVLGGRIQFKKADLSRPFRLPGKFDYIFQAAGYGQPAKFIKNPLATIAINVDATRALLDTARLSKGTLVFFSSAEVYGELPKGARAVSENYAGSCSATNARSVYGESKRMGEALCALFRREYGVDAKIVRLSHQYGPGISIHDARVLGDFMRKAFYHKKIELLSEGKEIKTFGYVADAVAMIMRVASHGKKFVYNVGGVDSISIRGLAELVGREIGVPVVVPKKLAAAKRGIHHPGFVKLDLSRILSEMKRFQFTPLRKGLKKMIEWNRKEFNLK